jgi:hypothetical protein
MSVGAAEEHGYLVAFGAVPVAAGAPATYILVPSVGPSSPAVWTATSINIHSRLLQEKQYRVEIDLSPRRDRETNEDSTQHRTLPITMTPVTDGRHRHEAGQRPEASGEALRQRAA